MPWVQCAGVRIEVADWDDAYSSYIFSLACLVDMHEHGEVVLVWG